MCSSKLIFVSHACSKLVLVVSVVPETTPDMHDYGTPQLTTGEIVWSIVAHLSAQSNVFHVMFVLR